MIPIITGVIGIVTALIIVLLMRRDRLHVRYGLWWMLTAVAFAMLGLFPWIFDEIARHLDIGYPPILALTLAIVVLLLKILIMDLERSRHQIRLNRLVQRIALLESEVEKATGMRHEHPASGEADDTAR